MLVTRPVAFPGTPEERAANYWTHAWVSWDHEEPPECVNCCAKSWHVVADYPCGDEPPHETVEVY